MIDKHTTALYIGADPFTFNDMELVKKCIKTFGFVHIFLDRKNRDAEHKEYCLNYTDRSDIVKHDLKEQHIEQFDVIPIDTTVQQKSQEMNIDTIVLNFDFQNTIDFRMMKIMQEINPSVNIVLMKANNFIERKFVRTLLDSDSTMNFFKKYCSQYAFYKLKLKFMKKIGLTGNDSQSMDVVQKTLESHGFKVVDVDKFLESQPKYIVEDEKKMYAVVNQHIAKEIIGLFNDRIIIRGKLLYEYAMEKMFNKMICVRHIDLVVTENLMSCEEKMSYADYIIDGRKDEEFIISNTTELINTKLKKF